MFDLGGMVEWSMNINCHWWCLLKRTFYKVNHEWYHNIICLITLLYLSFSSAGTYQKYVIRNIRRRATDRLYHCTAVTGVVQFQFITAFNTGESSLRAFIYLPKDCHLQDN